MANRIMKNQILSNESENLETARDKGVNSTDLLDVNLPPLKLFNERNIITERIEEELLIMGRRNNILAIIVLVFMCMATVALAQYILYLFL